ncbi:MAG: valine--tRNA ligase [Candidatus Omnitrophota bacterium]|nr:valine--tRNA ligase [Candidatus Omnitrophota bacterium]
MELSPRFNFKDIEDKWVKFWEEKDLFHATPDSKKKPYVIVIPPPNVTGILHMGHALNCTLQDIIIRYKRMNGFETLWMPGTDHAGIATQNVVEKQLAKEGKNRHHLGRDEFLKRTWEWKEQYGNTIIHQLKKLGASCDWARTRFTMDEEYSEAVKYTFVELYKKKLIYRGQYIINWCPRCQTALSDEEAEHKEKQGFLYHIRYPFEDNPNEGIVVATTRPETMLGDTAVAVNPKDKRYKKLIGKTLILPLMNREIRIIADELVDPAFGTGAVKVTPAHDPNDFTIGMKHSLDFINIMHPDARLNEEAGDFEGMDRFKAREAIAKALQERKLLVKVEPHMHAIGHCYRCNTVVEPYLSKQWFVKMKPLAKPALKAVVDGRIKFYPDRWTKVYTNWMEDIRDWCISRQIWWGHRIPVWYCVNDEHTTPQCQEPIVSMTTPTKCPHCGSSKLKQDEDVLDTWFSSWLWPFATLGWPKENKDLKYFYPGSALFTASEIIFFWVARMIMSGIAFKKDIPFSSVYIHGTVRDAKGRKMSKSLGNALDPLEIIHEYGADALRFSLIINSGQDLFVSKEKFEIGRNFANKIWNAARLILMNTKDIDPKFDLIKIKFNDTDLASQWIISRFNSTLEKVNAAIETYRFSEAETLLYDFFWSNFCDWYLEIIKDRFDDRTTQHIAFKILEQSLKIFHPFMPFVTEEIWQHIHPGEEALCIQPWPTVEKICLNKEAEDNMQVMIEAVSALRNIRVQWNIPLQQRIETFVATTNNQEFLLFNNNAKILQRLGRVEKLSVAAQLPTTHNVAISVVGTTKIAVPLGALIDVNKEKQRISTQIEEQRRAAQAIVGRLQNEGFLKKAPANVVDEDRGRLEALNKEIKELEIVIANLN